MLFSESFESSPQGEVTHSNRRRQIKVTVRNRKMHEKQNINVIDWRLADLLTILDLGCIETVTRYFHVVDIVSAYLASLAVFFVCWFNKS